MHEAHDGGLPEQRSSAAPPRPNGWAQRGASRGPPACFSMLLLRKLTEVCYIDAEKPQVTAVSARERVRARQQYVARTVVHSEAASSVRHSRGLCGRSLAPITRLVPAAAWCGYAPQQPTGCCHAGAASRRSRKGQYLQPADPPPPALSHTGRNSRYLSCVLAGRCWCAAVIAVDATGSDSRPVALDSRRFRAAPTARQVAAAQGRAACLPTLAHARVGLHGSSVRMPTIATYCIYSTKRTYHPACAALESSPR